MKKVIYHKVLFDEVKNVSRVDFFRSLTFILANFAFIFLGQNVFDLKE